MHGTASLSQTHGVHSRAFSACLLLLAEQAPQRRSAGFVVLLSVSLQAILCVFFAHSLSVPTTSAGFFRPPLAIRHSSGRAFGIPCTAVYAMRYALVVLTI